MENQRVVRGKTYIEPPFKKFNKGVISVFQEQLVIGQRGNGHAELGKVVEVHQHHVVLDHDSMIYRMRGQESRGQVVVTPGLSTMGAEGEGVETTGLSEEVEAEEVRVDVVAPVTVGWVVRRGPLIRGDGGEIGVRVDLFMHTLVINTVKPNYIRQ